PLLQAALLAALLAEVNALREAALEAKFLGAALDQEADYEDRLQGHVVLAVAQLLGVVGGGVEQRSLAEVPRGLALHLQEEVAVALVAPADVEDRQLVLREFLLAEGTEQGQRADAPGGRLNHRVEHVLAQLRVDLAAACKPAPALQTTTPEAGFRP